MLASLLPACATEVLVPPRDGAGEAVVVLEVVDGDTLVLADPERTRIRLAAVNAPETDECLADPATAELAALAPPGSTIRILRHGTDRYGRTVAEVLTSRGSVNVALAEAGLAISMAGSGDLTTRARAAEEEARDDRRGMWDPAACGSGDLPRVELHDLVADPPGPDGTGTSEELVTVTNAGTTTVDLSGWTLRDESSVHRFRFPAGTLLEAGASVSVGSGCEPRPGVLAWCDGPVWNNDGDTALLLDGKGAVVDLLRHDP